MKIYKYEVPLLTLEGGAIEIELPRDARIVHVDAQERDAVTFWAEVDDNQPRVVRKFTLVGTGHFYPDAGVQHVGTALMDDGRFVWHLLELVVS